ncbi:type II secretion system F family protein [Trichloromonas sp.]|uniref:type II secretion system F family protein n=1 Tax=Trichloromonas sp. TaxID=3069249 RepID=UPI003D813C48
MEAILSYWYRFFSESDYATILILTFLAVSSFAVAIAGIFLRKDVLAPRLSKLLNKETMGSSALPALFQNESLGFMAKVANPLHKIAAPGEEGARKKLRHKLLQAGFRSKQAYRNYLAAKVFCGLILPAGYLLNAMFYSINIKAFNICLILAFLGFFIPNIILLQLLQKRQMRITRAFPDALDLMVVCVEAGLGLDMIFKRVGNEIRSLCKDLSDEYYLTNLEVRAGIPRDESLKNMAIRTGVPEIANLITILIQTNKLGTSLARTLRVHADSMRTKRRQLAEERAAKTPVKLVFPLVCFIFPAMFVVLVGPAAIRIAKVLLPTLSGQ